MLPYLTRVERGKHPEGWGGEEEKEIQSEKNVSEAIEMAGCLFLSFSA